MRELCIGFTESNRLPIIHDNGILTRAAHDLPLREHRGIVSLNPFWKTNDFIVAIDNNLVRMFDSHETSIALLQLLCNKKRQASHEQRSLPSSSLLVCGLMDRREH